MRRLYAKTHWCELRVDFNCNDTVHAIGFAYSVSGAEAEFTRYRVTLFSNIAKVTRLAQLPLQFLFGRFLNNRGLRLGQFDLGNLGGAQVGG